MKNELKKCGICKFEDYARFCPFCGEPMWTKDELAKQDKAHKLYEKWEKYYDNNYQELKHKTIGMVNMADEEKNALYPDAGPNPCFRWMHKEHFVREKIDKYHGDKDIKRFMLYYDRKTGESIRNCLR